MRTIKNSRFIIILLLVCFCISLRVSAQQTITVKGVISKKMSADRVPQVLISNLHNGIIMMSDDIGWFTIKASVGDTLLFVKKDYTSQKIVVINSSDMPVYLQPVIQLAEVKIQRQTKRQELSDVMNTYRNKGIYFDGKPPLSAFSPFGGSPITGLYELFGKEPKRLRRFAAFTKDEIEYSEVHRRYTMPLVIRVTKLTDTAAVKKFMEYYTPTFDDLKEWGDYELIDHVRKTYDYYVKNPPKPVMNDLKSKTNRISLKD